MTSKEFDPQKFIDREFEQELFEDLLLFNDRARILAIRDAGGMGKSQLLEKFHYRCRTVKPRTPVSLIALDQLGGSTPLFLVRKIREHLSAYGIEFPSFTRYEAARMSADFDLISESVFRDGPLGIVARGDVFSRYERGLGLLMNRFGSAHIRYTELLTYEQRLAENISEARRHGDTGDRRAERAVVVEQLNLLASAELRLTFNELCGGSSPEPFAQARGPRQPEWAGARSTRSVELTPDQELVAQEVSIQALFDDLRPVCAERPVVLLIDAYEKGSDALKDWLVEYLLERQFFDLERRPARLLLVVAGRDIPAFNRHWSAEDCRSIVRSVDELGKWTRDHVEECLRVHGFAYEPKDVDAFHHLIDRGIPPSQMIQMAQSMAAGRRRA
jgi:hypothetical protein